MKNKNTDMNSDKGDFKDEQTRADDDYNGMHVSKEQRPDTSEIAAAAQARAEVEEANRKARKEKAEKQKELARRAEEEEIAAKKRAAAEAGEALERKNAQKDAEARAAAKTAAEGRAEERGAGAATQGIVAAATDERAAAAHGKPSGRENGEEKDSQRLPNRTAGQKEARRAEEKKIAEAGETSKEKEARKLEPREAAARAALERLAKAGAVHGTHVPPASSENEMHARKGSIVDVKSGKCGIPERHGSIKEEQSWNPIHVPYKNEKQERETNSASNDKHSLKEGDEKDKHEQCNRNTKPGIVKEEDLVSTADNRAISQQIMGVQEENTHGKESGKRQKEGINERSSRSENSQAGQNNGRSIITIQQNENARYKQEKEIVSVTGDERERSKESGSVKGEDRREAVAVMGAGRDGSEKSESFRGGQRSYSQYTEPNYQKKVQDTQMEKNKQEHSHRHQNEQNSHDRGETGDARSSSQQDKHNRRSQQQYMTPAKRDGDFQYQQNHHRQPQKSQYYDKTDQSYYSYRSQHHTQPVQQKLAWQGSRALICGSCSMKYSLPKKVPRSLHCGHSVCTPCIGMHIYRYGVVLCPTCRVYTWYAKKAEDCPVNHPLVNILSEEIKQDALMEENQGKGKPHFSVGNGIRQSQSHPVSDSRAGSGTKQSESKFVLPRSPHGSKCMEMGVRPSSYCVTCRVWVCVQCAEAEHSTKRCLLRPLKDQLSEMKQGHEFVGKKAHELLGKSLQSLENSLDQDKIFLLWLKAAFECIEKKQEDMKNELQEGRKHMNTLADVIVSLPRVSNLPEALAAFQVMDDMTGVAQQWTTDTELSVTGADQETVACLKHLMKRTLRSLQVKNGISEMFAVNKIPDGDMFSELMDEGGRFHLHALKKGKPTKQGTQILPLQCFKSCQVAGSTLVFLDLSWGGTTRGRIYIRLTGDTLRGRQFISLCIGERSISFRGTRFHRVWAKGKPGEHVWTGDYEKGDGSGGRSLLSTSSQEQVPAGREVPISAGLVAGRYEKKDISSIFRIYTREEKEARDEAGFGQVEFGLDVLKEAVRLKNIIDVMISDCGLVLEM